MLNIPKNQTKRKIKKNNEWFLLPDILYLNFQLVYKIKY